MTIQPLSENFTPLHRGILFLIENEGDTTEDILVEILDGATNEVIATQQLRCADSVTLNIAPYASRFADYAPTSATEFGFAELPTASYRLRIGDTLSEAIIVAPNRTAIASLPSLATTLPTTRRIGSDECDEVAIFCEEGSHLAAEIWSDTGQTISLEYTTTSGAALLHAPSSAFEDGASSFEVTLYHNGESLATLNYHIAPSYATPTRLAWISRLGTIEHYTFPASYKRAVDAEKSYATTSEGRFAVQGKASQLLSLSSRYEPSATIEALSDIVASPKVWIACEDGYRSVEVVTSSTEQTLFGEPCSINLTLCTARKGVAL